MIIINIFVLWTLKIKLIWRELKSWWNLRKTQKEADNAYNSEIQATNSALVSSSGPLPNNAFRITENNLFSDFVEKSRIVPNQFLKANKVDYHMPSKL